MPCGLVCRHTRAPSASTWLTACRALPAQVRQAYENALRFDPAHPNALENMHKFFWSQDRQHSQGSQATVPSLPQQGRAASQGSKGAGGAGHGGKRQEAGHAGKTIQDLPTAPPQDFARASNACAAFVGAPHALRKEGGW